MSTEAVNGWQTTEPEPQSPRGERVTWGIAIAVVVMLVMGVAAFLWHQHQSLAVEAASVPANMELDGATRGEVTRHYTDPSLPDHQDAAPTLAVTYALADPDAALASLESQMRADGWTVDTTTFADIGGSEKWVKPGSGIEFVAVSQQGSELHVVLHSEDQ
jgi:hypothetical protein